MRDADGIVLAVRLTPKGGRDSIDGVDTLADGTVVLKARVRAAPSEGEANAALVPPARQGARRPTGPGRDRGRGHVPPQAREGDGRRAALGAALEKIDAHAG